MASEDYRRAQGSAQQIRSLSDRIEALERGATLRSAGIGAGGMHVNGGSVFVEQGGDVEINDGGFMRVNDGGGVAINNGGDIGLNDGGSIRVNDGGAVRINGGGDVIVRDGGRVKVFDGGGVDINGGSLNAYAPDGNQMIQLYGGTMFLRRLDTETSGYIYAAQDPDYPNSSSLRFKPPRRNENDPTQFYLAGRGTDGQGSFNVTADATTFATPSGSAKITNIQGPTGGAIFLDATKQIAITTAKCFVSGDFTVTGTKNFEIPHPTKPGHKLMHGSTESPVSGLEYWGEAQLDGDGHTTVLLPDYFEALAATDSRAVFLTPIGTPAALAATRITGGKFSVDGPPGTEFTWLAKARRGDTAGQFDTEPLADAPIKPVPA